jgi:hypothetical protein
MTYSLQQLVMLAASLEPAMMEIGCHIAIGGSCVHRGCSDKDMDVFVYPHKDEIPKAVVRAKIESLGFTAINKCTDATQVPDVLPTTDQLGNRVDFFFLIRPAYVQESANDEKPLPLF